MTIRGKERTHRYMYFHSASLQPIDNGCRQKQMGLHHSERGGKNSNRIFLCTGVPDDFFGILKIYDTTIKLKTTSFHCSDTGCMYYKVDYKTNFQDDSNEEFIIFISYSSKVRTNKSFSSKI
jgi:hypothetical protein